MRTLVCLAVVSICGITFAQDADALLARVARHEEAQGRQALIELEQWVRSKPAAEVEKRFIAFLRGTATVSGKAAVCRHLSVMGTSASVPALAQLLSSEETVEMARYALERIPGEVPVDALRAALLKAPLKSRTGIINSLGVRRDTKAVPMLAKLASGVDSAIGGSAISALGRIASNDAIAALQSLRAKGSVTATQALLVAAETLRSPAIYRDLFTASAPAPVRVAALRGLASTEPQQAVARYAAALEDRDANVQAAAISGLGAIVSSDAEKALLAAMPKFDAQARARAIAALSMRANPPATAITKALEDVEPAVRASVLEALSRVSEPAAVPRLATLAASGSETDRAAARLALERMPGVTVDRAILTSINNAEPAVKIELVRVCGLRGIAEAADILLASASSSDRALRREALRALRESAGQAQIAPMLELLTSARQEADRREVERAVASALRRSPPAAGATVLSAYRAATAGNARASLLQILGQAGSKDALPVLMQALNDPSPDIVRAAILALTEWPEELPLTSLLVFAARTQNAAHQTLALRGVLKLLDLPTARSASDTVSMLEQIIKLAQQPDEKKAVLSLLPRVPSASGLKLAESAMADPALAEEAKIAVQRLKRALSQ
ncbi:MAG: HEAT repeat domain-containing protein [Bryobacterales bacterium]|nr:HEAT repeat domain-containing protein [Bryobacterales bacterium]